MITVEIPNHSLPFGEKNATFVSGERVLLTSKNLEVDLNGRFPMEVIKAIKKGSLDISDIDEKVLKFIVNADWTQESLKLSDPTHQELAALAVVRGAPICYGFGNFYAVAGHPCWE